VIQSVGGESDAQLLCRIHFGQDHFLLPLRFCNLGNLISQDGHFAPQAQDFRRGCSRDGVSGPGRNIGEVSRLRLLVCARRGTSSKSLPDLRLLFAQGEIRVTEFEVALDEVNQQRDDASEGKENHGFGFACSVCPGFSEMRMLACNWISSLNFGRSRS